MNSIPAHFALVFLPLAALAANPKPSSSLEGLNHYFKEETRRLAENCLGDVPSLSDWQARREALRQELFEMLSLSPQPVRTDLKPVVTSQVVEDEFTVENLHFQSMPGLYVTGNLYLPKARSKPAPAILYVCGHAFVITNGVSYGNKTAYQHHGAWFARNGYVCLTIDTVQLGEIQGIHHGTYREGMWWWNARGYSSAGVEAWNCIRAIDYLQERPEVDPERIGVTGRSGGGAYSWWVAALDERVKAAAPVAGITDLENHVVDGVVEGHCDCMFIVNTYRWDYAQVAALVAPRPLLICNSDKDSIFPLSGVVRLHSKVASIYRLYGATNQLGLLITEGPHRDTQDLQLPVFRWFNRHLRGEDPRIEMAATRFFTPAQLKVLDQLPADERTSKIHESFVPLASHAEPPPDQVAWEAQRDGWRRALTERVFRGWPQEPPPLERVALFAEQSGGKRLVVYEFTSDHDVRLRLYVLSPAGKARSVRFLAGDEQEWSDCISALQPAFSQALQTEAASLPSESKPSRWSAETSEDGVVHVFFAPRGVGLTRWDVPERKRIQIRRRFMLLGQTLDGMRVWDIRRALETVRSLGELSRLPFTVEGTGAMGVNALYATLFEPAVDQVRLIDPPVSHRQGPDYLNVLRFLDIPQAVALAAERERVELLGGGGSAWEYPAAVVAGLGWAKDSLRIGGKAPASGVSPN